MKSFLFIVSVVIFGALISYGSYRLSLWLHWNGSQQINSELKVEWQGWCMFATPYRGVDPGFYGDNPPPSQFVNTEIEYGLRSDGVIVWRKYEKK